MCLLDLAIDKFWGRLKSIKKKTTKSIKFKPKKESLIFNLFERLWTHVDEKKTGYDHISLDAWKFFLHKRNKLKRTVFPKITSIYKVDDIIFLSMTGVETTVGRRLLFSRFLSCNFYGCLYSGVRKLSQYLNFIAGE